MMMGRFLRSLYVGRSTEYLFFDDLADFDDFLGAMFAIKNLKERQEMKSTEK